ncbi:MAG: (Fe-S)-binding protein [Deltaproteobacteria bacterium]|nr:(Fe-S)-binding protein [Deltaproteobacteria bacterium]
MLALNQNYWGVSGYIIFWLLFVISSALFLRRVYILYRHVKLGRECRSFNNIPRRLLATLGHVFGQWCQFKSITSVSLSNIGHALIAWGFFIFVLYYFLYIIIGAGFGISETLKSNRFFFYYSWIMDIVALAVFFAALWGIIYRYLIRPPRLKGEQTIEALIILLTVLMHPITHLFREATGIALGNFPVGLGTNLPFFSFSLSRLFNDISLSSVQKANIAFFWLHWLVVLFVLVFISYSRYLHLITAPINIFLRPSRPNGALDPIDFGTAESFGISGIRDFTRKQLLETLSCVVCGRCQDSCPAFATQKSLNPKKLVQNIKLHLLQAGPALLGKGTDTAEIDTEKGLVGEVTNQEDLWACTTCGACVESCPVSNNQTGMVIELRRKLVYEGIFDRGHKKALQRVARDFNPWGVRWKNRAKNAGIDNAKEGERYDCIYWLGCVAAFDERVREVAQATAKILRASGLKFAMLGNNEKCCGDFVRRIGDEGLFQRLAVENIETLMHYDFDFILTHCPHCFNTLKNEYPDFGGDFKVVHHTKLINDFLKDGRIRLQGSSAESGEKIIYHDPCYLGRHNGFYNEPRQILKEVFGNIIEFPRKRNNSFCCGAGGGHMWIENEAGVRMSGERLAEAINNDANSLATACPFCFLMFQEAIQVNGDSKGMELRDIAEIVERFLR